MRILLILLFALVVATFPGCTPKVTKESKAMKNNPNSAGGKETCEGPKILRGKLYHTKGRMGEVGGYILSGLYLTGENGVWKPEFEALVGKEVEVKGVHYRYVCGPIEQCLEGGVINYLREIEYLRAAQ
jgi:hypothetical protein